LVDSQGDKLVDKKRQADERKTGRETSWWETDIQRGKLVGGRQTGWETSSWETGKR
jgi:hypothetical protein